MYSPRDQHKTDTPRHEQPHKGTSQSCAVARRDFSPCTAPKPKKRNRICPPSLKGVAEVSVAREQARELQPLFADNSDTSTECSPRRCMTPQLIGGRVQPFSWPLAGCSLDDGWLTSPSDHGADVEMCVESPAFPVLQVDPELARLAGNDDDDVHDSSSSMFSPGFCSRAPLVATPLSPARATATLPASPFDTLYSEAMRGDVDSMCATVRKMRSVGVEADVDGLNSLLRRMCRVHCDPEVGERLVQECCQEMHLEPNASTLCYLSDLWVKHEQLGTA